MTVYLLVDCLYYPGAFSTRERALAAKVRWERYCGRSAQIATLTIDELVIDKYEHDDGGRT